MPVMRIDRLSAAPGIAAVDEDLGSVARELERDRSTDAGGRARHERALSFEGVLGDG